MNIKEVQSKNKLTKSNSSILNALLVVDDVILPPQIYFSDLKEKRIKAMTTLIQSVSGKPDKVIHENNDGGDIDSLITELRTHINEYTGTWIVGCNEYCIPLMTKDVLNIANIFDKIAILLAKYKVNQDLNSYYKGLNGFSRGKFKNMLIKDLDTIANKHDFSYDKKQVAEQF